MTDPLSIVEAAYRFDLSDAECFRQIGLAAASVFPGARGLLTYTLTGLGDEQTRLGDTQLVQGDEHLIEAQRVVFSASRPEALRSFLFFPPAYLSMRGYEGYDLHASSIKRSREMGVGGFLGFFCTTGEESALVIGALYYEPRSATTAEEAHWAPVVRHLSSAFRLRQRLSRGDQEEREEALFSPEGRCLGAKGAASSRPVREALRQAVLERERRRSRRRRPSEPKDLWPSLVSGRYTLIDRFEGSGRRFLVAVRNDPLSVPLHRLTALI